VPAFSLVAVRDGGPHSRRRRDGGGSAAAVAKGVIRRFRVGTKQGGICRAFIYRRPIRPQAGGGADSEVP
jgi:hypothetical protein